MVRCCNSKCSVQWYHYTCIGVTSMDVVNDWWCSDSCENSGNYVYCLCGKSTDENDCMVQCELGNDCLKSEWYHPSCLCMKSEDLPGLCTSSCVYVYVYCWICVPA